MGHQEQKTALKDHLGDRAEFYRIVADYTYDWEYWQDPDGNFIYVSPSSERITGYKPQEFEQDKELFFQIMHPSDRKRMREHFHDEMQHRQLNTLEFRIRRRDGRQRWISHVCVQAHDREGRFLGWRSSNRDITDQKQTAEQLRESHEQLLMSLKAARAGSWALDLQTKQLTVDNQMLSLFGLPPDTPLDRTAARGLVVPEDLDRIRKAVQNAVEQHGSFRVEIRIRQPNGSLKWVSVKGQYSEADKGPHLLGLMRDVTERRQREEERQQTNRRLRELQEELARVARIPQENPNPILQVSHDGVLLWMNDAAHSLCGSDWCLQLGSPVSETLRDCCRRVVEGQTEVHTELSCGDRLFWMIFNKVDGYVNVYGRDVTERRAAQEALEKREQQLRAVLENSLDAAYRRDLVNNRYDYISPVIEQILGYNPVRINELPIEEVLELVHPDDRNKLHESMEEAHQKGRGILEYRFRCNDGNYHWLSDQFVLETDDQGRQVYRTGTIRDITKRVEAEAALRAGEQRLTLAQEAGHVGIFDWNMAADQSVWNEEMYRIYGLTPGEYENPAAVLYYNLVHPDDRQAVQRKLYQTISRKRAELNEVYRILRPDGQVRWVNNRGIVTYSPEGQPVRIIGTAVDITDQKEAEEVLRRSHEELEQRVRQRTEEMVEMVEQLRREARQRAQAEQKLSLSYQELQNRAEQLARLASELTLAEQRERHRLAQILHDHLQQLLVAAKMELGALLPETEDGKHEAIADAMNLIGEAIQESRSLSMELSPPVLHKEGLAAGLEWLTRWFREKHNLTVELDTSPDADTRREDIRTLMFQSLRELLFNTVKHAGVDQAKVSLRREDDRLRITLTDRGRGFDAKSVLEKGARATKGFGLFSIRERMALLGGTLEIESEPGRGATFRLMVPIEEETQEEGSTDMKETEAVQTQQVRILLVDDHAMVRRGMISMLKQDKTMVVVGEAGGGREAIDKARQLKPDVILMDLSMPDMDGVEATRAIHRELPDICILGLSMYEEEARAKEVLSAGACGYVSKADSPARLLSTIREAVGKRQ